MIQMKNGNEYKLLLSDMACKDKLKLKNSGLDVVCKNILDLMKKDPFCYPPSYEKLVEEYKVEKNG